MATNAAAFGAMMANADVFWIRQVKKPESLTCRKYQRGDQDFHPPCRLRRRCCTYRIGSIEECCTPTPNCAARRRAFAVTSRWENVGWRRMTLLDLGRL